MRKIAVLGAAAAAALLGGGAAHAQGYVGVSRVSTDFGGGSDLDTNAISGAVLLGEHFQANGRYASVDSVGDDVALDGFLFNRSDAGAFGGFLGYDTFDFSGGGSLDSWAIGGFGQLYRGTTNWTGQLGYSDTDGDVTVLHLDGEVRHFINDNFSVQANLGVGQSEASGFSDTNYLTAGLGAEFQFAAAPVSIYGGWQHIDLDDGGGEADSLGLGVRWNFGGASLLDRSRTGAGLLRNTPHAIELDLGGANLR